MDELEITSRKGLRDWLKVQPADWAAVISARGALRAIPLVGKLRSKSLGQDVLLMMRAFGLSWAVPNFPDKVVRDSVSAAFVAADRAGGPVAHVVATSISRSLDGPFPLPESYDFSPLFDKEAKSYHWEATKADCDWLLKQDDKRASVRILTRRSLWLGQPSVGWRLNWETLCTRLLEIDPNYSVWTDWYNRRIRGERSAFDIPGDKRRVEDKKILRRLAEATDEDFWGKGHEYVNATLKGWLDEARARVAPPPIIGDASGAFEISGSATGELGSLPPEVPAKLPSQNTNAISFRTDNDGRIAINADALADHLRIDAGARDRHEEAVNEARNALNRCQGNNAAARLTGLLTNYLVAAGENLEAAKPSLFVQRGERLRQELARYEAPDHMLPPVADDLLLDLKGWLTAHNMMVGLDPVLNAMDTAMLGPDRQPALIPPDEIREKAREAEEADLLQDGVIEVVEEAADLAPAIPDANDRHTIWSTEMVRNLMIETASVALNNPAATSTVVAVGAVLGSGLAVGIAGGVSIMGSIKAAEYLVSHKAWVLARLGNTPTWQALIAKLADWLEKITPFKPK